MPALDAAVDLDIGARLTGRVTYEIEIGWFHWAFIACSAGVLLRATALASYLGRAVFGLI